VLPRYIAIAYLVTSVEGAVPVAEFQRNAEMLTYSPVVHQIGLFGKPRLVAEVHNVQPFPDIPKFSI
jgi:hypothetical protein